MHRFAVVTCAALLLACSKSDNQTAADSGAAAAMTPAPVSVADFAGSWTVRAMPEVGDSTLLTFELMATADTTPWMMHFQGRPDPVPMRIITVGGDSIVTEAGPYASALRPGTQVTTRAVNRMMDGKIVATFEAHYVTAGADSVLRGRMEGVKKP